MSAVMIHKKELTAFEKNVEAILKDISAKDGAVATLLRKYYFNEVREIETENGKIAVFFVPQPFLEAFRAAIGAFRSALEKPLGDHTVFVVATRTIMPVKDSQRKVRPVSRTLTAVHDAILDDIVFPAHVVGKRSVYQIGGKKTYQVTLDRAQENIVPLMSTIYGKLTQKNVTFTVAKKN